MAPTLATNSPRLHFGEAVGDFGADSHLFWLVLRVRGRRLGGVMSWRDRNWWLKDENARGADFTLKGYIALFVLTSAFFGLIFLIAQHFNWYGLGE